MTPGGRPLQAVVTGASRGIGRAIALTAARRGYRLHLVSRTRAALEAVAAECRAAGNGDLEPTVRPTDLGDMSQVTDLADALRWDLHGLDLLVVNAGAAVSSSIADTSLDDWDRIFDLNVRSPFVLVRGLLPALRAVQGRIIVIGSVVSTEAYPLQGAYCASKHALYGFTKVLAKELHDEGITVQTVLPGGVATDMVRTMRPDIDTTDLIQPEDVAQAVATLLDMDGAALTDEIRLRRRGKMPWA